MEWNRGAASCSASVITIRRGRGELGNAVAARRHKRRKKSLPAFFYLGVCSAPLRETSKTLTEAQRK